MKRKAEHPNTEKFEGGRRRWREGKNQLPYRREGSKGEGERAERGREPHPKGVS